jgi:hypothetical protein
MDNHSGQRVQRASWKTAFYPAAVAVVLWLIFHITYDLLIFIEAVAVYRLLISINWVILVVLIGFSSIVIYSWGYYKATELLPRILAVYTLPLVWCIKEFIRVSGSVTTMEALFYVLFTPVQLLILIGQIGLMGISEIVCRICSKKKGVLVSIINPFSVAAILFTALILYFILIRGGGYDFHLMVKIVYRTLFL